MTTKRDQSRTKPGEHCRGDARFGKLKALDSTLPRDCRICSQQATLEDPAGSNSTKFGSRIIGLLLMKPLFWKFVRPARRTSGERFSHKYEQVFGIGTLR